MTKTPHASPGGNHRDDEFLRYMRDFQRRFFTLSKEGDEPLFTTATDKLWSIYLGSFPPSQQQYHNCSACRKFITTYGGLVVINSDGWVTPVFWEEGYAPDAYKKAVTRLRQEVCRQAVTGVFLTTKTELGTRHTGSWSHFGVLTLKDQLFRLKTKTAGQARAALKEDFRTVCRALGEFKLQTVEDAVALLQTEAAYRSEKVLGPAQWFLDLHRAVRGKKVMPRANIIWKAVATAPAGFCHPRTTMIGTLLEDLAAGKSNIEAMRSFNAKMDPGKYQRPTAPPAVGTIRQAEKLLADMGAERSLARRFCRLDEVEALWRPAPEAPAVGSGIFDHLLPKPTMGTRQMPPQTMTWVKFAATLLRQATKIQALVPEQGNFGALTTAVHPDAPPILQWDRPERRNPVSWYVWRGGARAVNFNLFSRSYVDVDAITLRPSLWFESDLPHQGLGVFLILKEARETRNAGAALFPEMLRSELHGVRSVIEAYSKTATIAGMDQPHAAGLSLEQGGSSVALRVWVDGRMYPITIDRWD